MFFDDWWRENAPQCDTIAIECCSCCGVMESKCRAAYAQGVHDTEALFRLWWSDPMRYITLGRQAPSALSPARTE